jgi:hypothetical protein
MLVSVSGRGRLRRNPEEPDGVVVVVAKARRAGRKACQNDNQSKKKT